MEALPSETLSQLLAHRAAWEPLYRLLGVPLLTLPQLLAKYAVPSMHRLDDKTKVGVA